MLPTLTAEDRAVGPGPRGAAAHLAPASSTRWHVDPAAATCMPMPGRVCAACSAHVQSECVCTCARVHTCTVCMYIYVPHRMHTRSVHEHVCSVHVCMHVCTCVYASACIACVCMCACACMCVHACTHVYRCVHACKRVHVCARPERSFIADCSITRPLVQMYPHLPRLSPQDWGILPRGTRVLH